MIKVFTLTYVKFLSLSIERQKFDYFSRLFRNNRAPYAMKFYPNQHIHRRLYQFYRKDQHTKVNHFVIPQVEYENTS